MAKTDPMKTKHLLIISVLFLSAIQAVRANPLPADSLRHNPTEEMIWASESAYFTRLYKADYEGVLLLTDSLFFAWPGAAAKPLGREESARFMKKMIPKPTSCKVTIERQGIRVTGGVALTQLLVHVSCPESQGTSAKTTRITHTWVKRGNVWRLLGGMSSEPGSE